MGETTAIAWTDKTWNPWQGCRKISPACDNCYMFRDMKRYGKDPGDIHRSTDKTFNRPLHWKDPALVFVCSWSDFFIHEADPWREAAWDIIRRTPHLTYQILTKRPERMPVCLPPDFNKFKNVWLGVTVENQKQAQKRIPYLTMIDVPVRFASVEPMLEKIDLHTARFQSVESTGMTGAVTLWPGGLDWVICGGESGPDARSMDYTWAEDLMMQCLGSRVPFFMKQMSGTKKSDRDNIPEHMMVRQFPTPKYRR